MLNLAIHINQLKDFQPNSISKYMLSSDNEQQHGQYQQTTLTPHHDIQTTVKSHHDIQTTVTPHHDIQTTVKTHHDVQRPTSVLYWSPTRLPALTAITAGRRAVKGISGPLSDPTQGAGVMSRRFSVPLPLTNRVEDSSLCL